MGPRSGDTGGRCTNKKMDEIQNADCARASGRWVAEKRPVSRRSWSIEWVAAGWSRAGPPSTGTRMLSRYSPCQRRLGDGPCGRIDAADRLDRGQRRRARPSGATLASFEGGALDRDHVGAQLRGWNSQVTRGCLISVVRASAPDPKSGAAMSTICGASRLV